MSAQQTRTINQQQETIRRQALIITRYQRAIENALPMMLAGHYQQAEKDLRRVAGGAK